MNASPLPSQSGVAETFLELRRDLANYARAIGAGDEAEDVLQEVWLKLPGLLERPENPKAYLYRMVYTALLDQRRGQRRAASRDAIWSLQSDVPNGPSSEPDPERILTARQALEQVNRLLVTIGEPAATILRRHRIDGLTQRVIAKEMGLGVSTVEKHLRRSYAALLKLRRDHEV